ncbi:MAG: glycerophosphoryl diester phosphodiesterase [Alphaproteobacteria bacterium]|nr:glycerophosphoryl diester phosphodiesterase [Alphaproteobacteria bacterium]MCB9974897.1 glycerophosphoryl diester phosphodiesterase [Rhodospirillales bacterium]
MTLKLPKIIGHRGAAAYAPENTLEGIHTAADMGVEWVELDVKLTKDQIPVIFHDDTLERTTNGSGSLANLTLEELRQYECGSWFSDSFAGIKIPTLEEALEVIIDRDLGFNMEIKPCPGRERETAEAALDILAQIWDDHNRILISSFSPICMETALLMAHDWPRALLIGEDWPENLKEIKEYLELTCINVNAKTVQREQVEEITDMGLPILAYTVNDAETARRLLRWGVDGVFSDSPDIIRETLFSVH